jgi:Protein of unknown function (DUF2946)
MDDIVKAAMARWPNVPAVYGWLELTSRGEWKIRGEPIGNAAIREFIGRNYTNDGCGNWFFQNGPQRVYVAVEATPIVYRLDEFGRLQAHTGVMPHELRAAFADAVGRLFLDTEIGIGLVDSQDTGKFAERLIDGEGRTLDDKGLERWTRSEGEVFLKTGGLHVKDERPVPVQRVPSDNWPDIFGFVARPGGGRLT